MPNKTPWMPHVLALLTVLIVGGVEGMILTHGAPPGLDGVVLGRVLGTMDSALIMVLSYYFGSSASSARQTEILADTAAPATPSAAAASPAAAQATS